MKDGSVRRRTEEKMSVWEMKRLCGIVAGVGGKNTITTPRLRHIVRKMDIDTIIIYD